MTLPISAERVATPRLTLNVLSVPGSAGDTVLFVHGNVSSSAFWRSTMTAIAAEGFRPYAVDLRGFGDSDPEPVDASRGVRDYSDDVLALLDRIGPAHLVGWSLGGGVVMQALRDRPEAVRGAVLVNPVSPYGFGGTTGPDGVLTHPDGAGSGGGAANPEFVAALRAGDRSADSPVSPRNVLRATYVAAGTDLGEEEDAFVESMLSTRIGDDHYPGDSAPTDAWPNVAPGKRGVLNTIAPTNFRIDDLHEIDPKPPILWIRGDQDVIVSDTSLFDLAHLGAIGAVPGWDGTPAQPMVTQTRAVLERYGDYREVVIEGAGHGPHLDKPEEFRAALLDHLRG
ncbi:alpha/beta hydrolase [Microbispora rosea subsp. aerata]|nr:alpha/beta hydrolase [Microbispora rosea]GGO08809.1 alpha/beta hydrolase [Microbispora rosea subsp. aerata]GIH55324.1 alpha/beta hydrolase [Microbispora rosea subsp. aerata]GLJ84521.1 alpha/beta hydrolase [Microbispora rosea subsp. aerata]